MIIKKDIGIADFQAWAGGKETLDRVIAEGKCDELESVLDEIYPDGTTDTELNDLLWFDRENIYEWIGIRTYDTIADELIDDMKWKLSCIIDSYKIGTITKIEMKQECDYCREKCKSDIASLDDEISELKS